MTGKKKDHWSTLASMLGMGGRAAEQESAEETPQPTDTEMAAESAPSPLPPAQPAPPPRPVRQPPKPKAAKPAPKRRDHWGSVLGQLGLAAPPPEPEPEPEPVESVEDFVASHPTASEVVLGKVDDEQPEGPPGYLGPDLEDRVHAEREMSPRAPRREERPRSERPRGDRQDRPRSGGHRDDRARQRPASEPRQRPPHSRYEDDVEIDEELDTGLRELWASHEAGSSAMDDVVDLDDVELEEAELESNVDVAGDPGRGDASKPASDNDDSRPRRRRRRRRGRGREELREGASRRPEPSQSREARSEENEEEVLDEEAPATVEPRQRRAESEDDEGRRPKRRRRRRRAEPTHSLPPESDDEGDDELEGPASVDYLGDAEKGESHKRIPTWDDAVGAVVAANMEARSRHPHPPRGREGRGRR